MKIVKMESEAEYPKKSHQADCGLDIFMPVEFSIKPLETKVIGLKLKVAIPEGFAGMLVPRSSTAKKGLIIQTSIIDPGYIGEIHLIVTNCSNDEYHVNVNDRLCSLVVYSILNLREEYVESLSDDTDRGDKGLGSSGV